MIEQRNCKACNKLFFVKRKNGVSCSSDCSQLIRGQIKKYYLTKDYKNKLKSDNKKIRMPKFNYHDNYYYWDK